MRPEPERPVKSIPNRSTRSVLQVCSVLLVTAIMVGGLAVANFLFAGKPLSTHPVGTHASPTATTPQTGITATLTPTPASTAVSPLIFGTNLGLFNSSDQFLTSSATRALMQQMHVRIIRMPVRSSLPNAVEIQAAQAIKSIGAAALVALHGMRDPNVVADDIAIVNDMNQVFGNSVVYYEFGNEDDYNGIDITHYTSGWNSVVPQLKHLALNGHFIGPVSYQYDRTNLTTFLQGANPRPDEISWHEYTCSLKDIASDCLAHIDNWTTHITDARDAMQTTLGTVLPIMITEWNYAPDQSIQNNGLPIDDGKYNNAAFMSAWTTKALQTLATNHVFASMQYTVTNTAIPMISYSNTLTAQGATFQSLYQQLVKNG